MAINIIQGYNPSTNEPIDSRLVKADATARYNIATYESYNGLLVYQKDTKELYTLVDTGSIGNSAGWQLVGLNINTGSFATTGSNIFKGNQIITGSINITGTYNGYRPLPTQASQLSGSVTMSYVTDGVYGTLQTPITGSSIVSDTASAVLGVSNIMIHSQSTAPTFGSDFKKLTGSSTYVAGVNYIFSTFISSSQIIYSIQQTP